MRQTRCFPLSYNHEIICAKLAISCNNLNYELNQFNVGWKRNNWEHVSILMIRCIDQELFNNEDIEVYLIQGIFPMNNLADMSLSNVLYLPYFQTLLKLYFMESFVIKLLYF